MSGYQHSRRRGWLTLLLLALLVSSSFGLALRPVYAATEIIGGDEVEGTLRVTVQDSGRMNVERYAGTVWQRQVFGGSAKASMLRINGTNHSMGGYYSGTAVTQVSNVRVGNVITTTVRAGSNVEIVQITSYTAGNLYYNLEWRITNTGETTLEDLRFFHGMDTYLAGGDNGAGWWDAASRSIGVNKIVADVEQRMSLRGLTMPHAYESRNYSAVRNSVNAGALQNVVDPNQSVDNGYAMEWRTASLAPGATWTVRAMETFLAGEVLDAPVITVPTEGATTNARPQISGTAPLDTSVTVRDASAETLCTATTDAEGAWSCTPSSDLEEGNQALTAIAERDGAVPSQPSAVRNFTVEAGPVPDAPTLSSPAAASTVGLSPTFSGTAEAGSSVVVADDEGNELCSATADDEGNWSCTPESDLPEGAASVSVTATNENGASEPTTRDFTAQAAPQAPTFTSPAADSTVGPRPTFSGTAAPSSTVALTDDEGNEVCSTTADAQGNWSCMPSSDLPEGPASLSATASNAGGTSPAATLALTVEHAPQAPTLTSPAADSTIGPRPTFSGTAAPSSTVVLTDDEGNEVCSTTADAQGNWSCTPSSDLPEGPASLSATASNAGGTSPAATLALTVEHAPQAPTITSPAADSTVGPRPTFSGTAAPSSTVALTDDEGNEVCSTTADAQGNWSCTPSSDLPEGPASLSATASNAGGTSPAATLDVTVEHAPQAPTITSPAAGSTVSPHPTFSGTAAPGSTVIVANEEDNELCRATVATDGAWSCTPTRALPGGAQTVSVTVIDAAGNVSEVTTRSFTALFKLFFPIFMVG